ncbi:hypothetical protein [Streptomyces sp. WAC06614]|uniref:hypothetical protein n=1 Tax=Streptomyces sp. WAC06614 TaxID=2487416 RepID=UPI000F79DBC2|nr:hypothetical protein [Streptomyces sp. WAC06614]RSS66680.1 hypothetical protein EF918_29440 [Streptomyces sp. WAC06614]
MKRTRIAALGLATAVAALAPALVEAASAAEGTAYLQDPAGGEKTMKSLWTKDEMHKLEGQLRFHPGVLYDMVDVPGSSPSAEWGAKRPDPKSLAWRPSFEFAWSVSDSVVVKKALTSKEGKHPITLYAVLRRPDGSPAAQVRSEAQDRAASGRTTLPGGRRIACDSGTYTVEWSLTRTGYGTLHGSLPWNASCDAHRKAFTTGRTPG